MDVVLSSLEDEESADLDLAREAELCQSNGIEFIAFPIPDRGVPASTRATAELVRRLEDVLNGGKTVALHCRQGVGRSALLAACLLVAAGVEDEAAFDRIRAARGCEVPDTAGQREWVSRFSRSLATPPATIWFKGVDPESP